MYYTALATNARAAATTTAKKLMPGIHLSFLLLIERVDLFGFRAFVTVEREERQAQPAQLAEDESHASKSASFLCRHLPRAVSQA
jgi:hypothetical protein